MFHYEDRPSFLRDVNPVSKILFILLATVLICLSFYPALPLAMLFFLTLLIVLGGNYRPGELLRQIGPFLWVCLVFALFLLVVRGLNGEGPYQLWLFRWQEEDFIFAFSLAMRILGLAYLSLFFVLTTDPTDLVLSIMLQLKLAYVPCYAALAAYRFLPAFRDELAKIRLARAIRGQELDDTFWQRLRAPFLLAIPLLAAAVRRGEQVAVAMESRAMGVYRQRTFLKTTAITGKDAVFLGITLVFLALVTGALIHFGLFHLNVGFQL